MTYHHVVRVQHRNGAVAFHRHEDQFVNADYWEGHHYQVCRQSGLDAPESVVCINVYKEDN